MLVLDLLVLEVFHFFAPLPELLMEASDRITAVGLGCYGVHTGAGLHLLVAGVQAGLASRVIIIVYFALAKELQ